MPRWLGTILATIVGAVLIAGLGYVFSAMNIGRKLTRFSYESLFKLREDDRAPQDVVIIYMTDAAGLQLQQRGGVWSRSLHADLIRRLIPEKPRAIFFDLIFSEPSEKPEPDPDLADAISQSGCTFLAGEFIQENSRFGPQERVIPPLPMFRKVAAGWGVVAFRPQEEDFGVRRLYAGTEQVPSCTWRMARWLGANLPEDYATRSQLRWVNYYGRVDCFDHVSYDAAMAPDGTPPGYFTNKIVMIGGRSSISNLNVGRDDFRHPLTGWVRASPDEREPGKDRREESDFAPGVEVHATILMNLLRGEWLERLTPVQENWLVIAFGIFLAILLPRFTPFTSGVVAFCLVVAVIAAAVVSFQYYRTWFDWSVLALVQIPVGLGWAISSRYFLIERRRASFRKAFAAYLSPHLATRLDTEELSLAPGGTLLEASIVFTDLENFTTLCEEMNDPVAISELLTWYFTRTTNQVLENDGTIIKYIGDSVFAVWGAPLRDSRHPEKAARAACRMHAVSAREIQGRKLRTRVGIHTGRVLAGNLGSLQRFDYTCIGDPVNLAARLESLNKYLGTDVLITEETLSRAGPNFVSRPLGRFQLAGKKSSVLVHELVGEKPATVAPRHFEPFALGLEAYTKGDLFVAERFFRDTIQAAPNTDGPAEFYLRRIAMAARSGGGVWDPVIEMTSK